MNKYMLVFHKKLLSLSNSLILMIFLERFKSKNYLMRILLVVYCLLKNLLSK